VRTVGLFLLPFACAATSGKSTLLTTTSAAFSGFPRKLQSLRPASARCSFHLNTSFPRCFSRRRFEEADSGGNQMADEPTGLLFSA
jgi:hypothetical protein